MSRFGYASGSRATAIAVIGLLCGGPATSRAASQPAPAPTPAATSVLLIEGGNVVSETTREAAARDGLTVIDLSDDWLPLVFSETPDKPQPLRPFLVDLANGRIRSGQKYARAREDRFFEAFGIFPSLNLVRRRLADKKRHVCHDRVKDGALSELSAKNIIPPEEPEKIPNPDPVTAVETPMIPTGRTISPRPLTPLEKRAVIAMQAHLRCEGLLPAKAAAGRMDRRTAEGLKTYQRLQMVADHARIDLETRTTLLGDSREHDFRALLRVLRERVVDATGLLEDGSALGVQGEVQGRVLDSEEFRPLPTQPVPSPSATAPVVPAQPATNIRPAPDLIAAATQVVSQALGWTGPDAVLASALVVAPPQSRKARKTLPPLPTTVAVRLPAPPAYHSAKMDLRAEIDRGEVVLARPKLDKDGHKRWRPPVADRPTLTLYARDGDHEIALARWPTTIGGWKTFEKSDGTVALKYKESITGEALWPEVLATPSWHPAPGMPIRKLLIKSGDTFVPKTEIIGPGYRAAYGLVAIPHHQIMERNEQGEPQLMDFRIRTHGTPAYRSVKRGESNGCHRLHNYAALRLAGFLVRHREHVRDGLVPEDYVRNLEYKGQKVALQSDSKGYRFKLTPPVPVMVLDGDVKGDAKSIKRMVPLVAVP